MRRGCLIGLWFAAAPFAWFVAWVWAASRVDGKALGLGGAGPDEFDFIDMKALLLAFVALMAVWALILLAAGAIGTGEQTDPPASRT